MYMISKHLQILQACKILENIGLNSQMQKYGFGPDWNGP